MKTVKLDDLNKQLKKAKDRELMLLTELAIRENDELEDGIVSIVSALVDAQNTRKACMMMGDVPKVDVSALKEKLNFLQSRYDWFKELGAEQSITHYARLVKDTKSAIKKAESGTAGIDGRRLHEEADKAEAVLFATFEEWKGQFDDAGVDLLELIPGLRVFIK